MMVGEVLSSILASFLTFFVIMDVFGNVPVFVVIMSKMTLKDRVISANRSIVVASIILFIFLFLGEYILAIFGISIDSFKIAGGIILLILGIKFVLGLRFSEQRAKTYQWAVVPISMPLLVGPGTLTAAIILVKEYNFFIVAVAAALNLLVAWYVLRRTSSIFKVLGRQGSDILARMMGLIITALSIEYIMLGIQTFWA